MWKFSSVISLWICLWWTWSEQKGQYGLSWHQFDIAAGPFCPATSRLMFARSCQLKSSVTFWLLMCHFASPTQTAAQKRPQPCIYPKACISQPPEQKKSSRLSVSSQIIMQMETITYFQPSASYRYFFTLKVRAHGTRNPRRPCLAFVPQIHAHSTHLKI